MTDRSSHHSSYFLHHRGDHTRDRWLLTGMRITRELSSRLVLFFLPVFLFQQGGTYQLLGPNVGPLQQGLVWTALFFLCRNLVSFATSIRLVQLMQRIGLHRSLVLSQLSFVGYFWVLLQAIEQPWLVFLAAAIDGIQVTFWASYYTISSQSADHKQYVSDIGVVNFLLTLLTILVSIVGGWLAVWLGFSALFLVGVALLLLGAIFALLLKPAHTTDVVSWTKFSHWLHELGYQKLTWSYVGRYWNDAAQTIWPLYVFFLVGALDKVGYLYGLSMFLALIVAYLSTRWVVMQEGRRRFFVSGAMLSLVWFIRTGVEALWSIVAIDALERLVASFHWLFFDTQFMSRGQGSEALSFFTYREVTIAAAAILFWSVFIVAFGIWLWPLKIVFMVAGVGVGLSLLVREHKDA